MEMSLIILGSMFLGFVMSLVSVALGAYLVSSTIKGKAVFTPDTESESETGAFSIDTSDDAPLFPEADEVGTDEVGTDEAYILEKTQKFLKTFGGNK
jgi:hypothetical protein